MITCVDVQPAVFQRAGVGRYTLQLVRHLLPLAGADALRLVYFDFRHRAGNLFGSQADQKAVRWCPGRLAQAAWKTLHWPPYDLFAGKADVFHFPNFTLPPLHCGRSAVTIHDMSFWRYPEFAEERNLRHLRAQLPRTVARADAILTVSRFSAAEVQDCLKVPADRIFPIHLGIDRYFQPANAEAVRSLKVRLGLNRPYLLTVGTVEPRKNLSLLLDVFERLTDFDGDLVIAGMPGWKCEPTMVRMAASHKSDSIRYLRYVADEDLPALYTGAELFLTASFYEGFGFPALESMACGTPVLSSNGGSLPEVLGDAALISPDFDIEHWLALVRRALGDTALRKSLTERGRRQAALYSWKHTAEQTWSVYRALGGGAS